MSRGLLKTSVSRKTICFDDINISCVNLMVAWKEFAKSIKLLISVSEIVHTENMSSINRMACKGLHLKVASHQCVP